MSEFFPAVNHPGIFSSPEWLFAWRAAWGRADGVFEVEPSNDSSNFYYYQKKLPLRFKIKTLFPAGISTSAAPSLRSEYFSISEDTARYLQSAFDSEWDQFYIPDILVSSEYYQRLLVEAENAGLVVRVKDTALTYAVDLINYSFDSYLASLGANSRLKLFNKRKKLYQTGDVQILNFWPKIDEFIEILNEFHQRRWGKPCYQGRNLQQIKLFLNGIAESGEAPDLSVICCNKTPVSAVLDVNYRNRIYNIQSGYLENIGSGISLGTLHFGFQLEQAFKSGSTHYDFMAGNGKNSAYKKSLATHSDTFVSLMLLRNPLLNFLYKVNDKIKVLKNIKAPAKGLF